jgi:hypothetical protein
MKKVGNAIKGLDMISQPPSEKIYFGEKDSHKTVPGGCCTIAAIVTFLLYAVYQLLNIIELGEPFINSQEMIYQENHTDSNVRWKHNIDEGFHFYFNIRDMWDYHAYDKSIIHMYVKHETHSFQPSNASMPSRTGWTGPQKNTVVRKELRLCTMKDFGNSDLGVHAFGIQWTFNALEKTYCIDTEEFKKEMLQIYGTHDDSFCKFKWAELVLEVKVCNPHSYPDDMATNPKSGYVKCKSPKVIDEWLKGKQVVVNAINPMVNFLSFSDIPEKNLVRNIVQTKGVKLNRMQFTEEVYHYRRNVVHKSDSWWDFAGKPKV